MDENKTMPLRKFFNVVGHPQVAKMAWCCYLRLKKNEFLKPTIFISKETLCKRFAVYALRLLNLLCCIF